ncbi:AAA family ATPase [Micromonospora carbonacea]|uniref:AAA family ATPase n=1 Tax=Micromonospora carbonacea TaxID=47853 RepID=UPI00332516CA
MANGIWLCQEHARLVDTNNGDAFPAKLLIQWRSIHESFLHQEMRGIASPPVGLITEITIRGGPGDLASRNLSLSMLNLVQGANETGKSMLLDLLACPDAPRYLSGRRWINGLSAEIRWFDPNPRALHLEAPLGQMRLISEDRSTPVVSAPYRAIVVRGGQASLRSYRDLARELGLSEQLFIEVLAQVPQRVRGLVVEVTRQDSVPIVRLDGLPGPLRCDESASFGRMWIVLLECAIALAQIRSGRESTLLLIDEPEVYLHPQIVYRLFHLLGDRTSKFQTLVVSHAALPADVRRGWSEFEFRRRPTM